MNARTLSAAMSLTIASVAPAQVVINEVYENPPGSGSIADAQWEYIELYGQPGLSLDGYAIGLVKGGTDPDGDDIPTVIPEIDEAFSLDGLSI
ncbi:MAG: lamin tail domain-containing protein, partial [Okeania sp. SIO3C4]|nr:lamin tail domain-containing protein [Okeania sp. SIO3C4]